MLLFNSRNNLLRSTVIFILHLCCTYEYLLFIIHIFLCTFLICYMFTNLFQSPVLYSVFYFIEFESFFYFYSLLICLCFHSRIGKTVSHPISNKVFLILISKTNVGLFFTPPHLSDDFSHSLVYKFLFCIPLLNLHCDLDKLLTINLYIRLHTVNDQTRLFLSHHTL